MGALDSGLSVFHGLHTRFSFRLHFPEIKNGRNSLLSDPMHRPRRLLSLHPKSDVSGIDMHPAFDPHLLFKFTFGCGGPGFVADSTQTVRFERRTTAIKPIRIRI